MFASWRCGEMVVSMKQNEEFTFRKQDTIGSNDAEDDRRFLKNCFIDTGDYATIIDFEDSKCIILGRTGTGKTALLTMLRENKSDKQTVITMDPEALAMQHISNSPIIRQIFDLGIDMNTFFKLLWRHEICVEIFSHHFKISTESAHDDLMEQLRNKFRKNNTKHLRALDYLQEWKNTFWRQDSGHIIEMVNRTETELGGALGAMGVGLKAKKTLSSEQKKAMQIQAQSIVNETQMKEVAHLIGMLDEVIEDQQKRYYVVIDELDEGWVEDDLRYRLIKSLIETMRDLNRCKNIKPLVVLRQDLLWHVFEVTQDHGFQEEKYTSLYMHVTWTRRELTSMLDKRINYSFKSRYRKKHDVTHEDILPEKIRGTPAIDYILDRTLMRPRDAIDFFNICIRKATESAAITEDMVLEAERVYSRERLKSMYYEWLTDYPKLEAWVQILRDKASNFYIGSLNVDNLRDKALKYAIENSDVVNDRFFSITNDFAEDKITIEEFRSKLIHILFSVGLIGLQLNGSRETIWSYDLQEKISPYDIDDKTIAYIHPCFHSAFNMD